MDERLARIVLNAVERAQAELAMLPPLLREHASEQVHDRLRMPLARAISDMRREIEDPIFELFPALKAEFEQNVDRFGLSC